jgi:hypothetical protein
MAERKKIRTKPRVYDSPEDMQKDIDKYFDQCEETGEMPLIGGLVECLDFKGRRSLYDYEGYSAEFAHIIARARNKVAIEYEKCLMDHRKCNGARFALELGLRWGADVHNSGSDGNQPIVMIFGQAPAALAAGVKQVVADVVPARAEGQGQNV